MVPSPQIWRYHFNTETNKLEVIREDEIDVYLPVKTDGRTLRKYYKQRIIPYREPPEKPATVTESDDGALQLKLTGAPLHITDAAEEHTAGAEPR